MDADPLAITGHPTRGKPLKKSFKSLSVADSAGLVSELNSLYDKGFKAASIAQTAQPATKDSASE